MGNNGISTGLKAAWDMMHLTGPHERTFFCLSYPKSLIYFDIFLTSVLPQIYQDKLFLTTHFCCIIAPLHMLVHICKIHIKQH